MTAWTISPKVMVMRMFRDFRRGVRWSQKRGLVGRVNEVNRRVKIVGARGNGSPGTSEQGTKTREINQGRESKLTRNSTIAAFFMAESADPPKQGKLVSL
jgi:hypothetical protein